MKIACTLFALIFAMSALQAQDIESKLSGNTATHGFTVKKLNGDPLFTIRGDGPAAFGTLTPEFLLTLNGDGGIMAKGTLSSGLALGTTGAGTRLFWYPKKSAFRAGTVNGTQWDEASIGVKSVAMGDNCTASGAISVAFGSTCTASGDWSTAFGAGSLASGSQAVAIGVGAVAVGQNSVAAGIYAQANSVAETAVGAANASFGNASTWVATDPVFEVGNGTGSTARSNAMTILKNGNVGIGTTTPEFLLSLSGDGGILAKGTHSSGASLTSSGAGTRMIWYPKKSAFRAGYVAGTQWDDASIGNYSTAMGQNCVASGSYSFAIGSTCSATADWATAIGGGSTASATSAIAIGNGALASGENAVGLGIYARAVSLGVTAVGCANIGSGSASSWVATDPIFEVGNGTGATARSNAMTVLKNGNVGIGTTTPTAKLQVEAGSLGITGSESLLKAIDFKDNTSGETWSLTHRLHTEGNKFLVSYYDGSGWINPVTILSSGNVGIGSLNPMSTLHVNGDACKTLGGTSWTVCSDARLKDVDGIYQRGLSDIIKLRSIRFHYKPGNALNLQSDHQEVGFIAQEAREVFPESVTENANGYLTFSMHSINVALVNAVKELNQKLESEHARNVALEESVTALRNEMKEMRAQLARQSTPDDATRAELRNK
jgi:trimeric autotransporter adhesin